jgi:hypothetical protein
MTTSSPAPNVPSRTLRTEDEIFQAGLDDTRALGEHPSPEQAERIAALLRPHADQLQAPGTGAA